MATAVQTAPENGVSAPETGDSVASFTDQVQTTTIKTAAEMRAELDSAPNSLETEALPLKEAIDKLLPALEKVFPLLVIMQALLSQRGAERLRHEAGLPTWSEYYREFAKKHGLPSLRTFQRKLAAYPAELSLHGDDKREVRPL